MLKCGLLGEKLGHSYSPQIHSMLADYEYKLFEKSPEELEDFLKSGEFDGLNVTIPYKKSVMPYCAELSPTAAQIGSVNTIVRRWKEADKYFKNIVEMKLTKEADGSITYARKNVSRQWDDKMYLFPIPQTERIKNPNLSQNPGW